QGRMDDRDEGVRRTLSDQLTVPLAVADAAAAVSGAEDCTSADGCHRSVNFRLLVTKDRAVMGQEPVLAVVAIDGGHADHDQGTKSVRDRGADHHDPETGALLGGFVESYGYGNHPGDHSEARHDDGP